MIVMRQEDFDAALIDIGVGDGEAICQWESTQRITEAEFQRRLRGAGSPAIFYDKKSWNCLAFARWKINRMNMEWAVDHPGEPPVAWGIITGDVPLDGDNAVEGWHALLFCFCEEGLVLGGAQDNEAMGYGRVKEIKAVEYLIIGGG